MTVDQGGTVVQRDDYYPFGGSFNHWNTGLESQYKFSNKELQSETQLYDFGARMYDPYLAGQSHLNSKDFLSKLWIKSGFSSLPGLG